MRSLTARPVRTPFLILTLASAALMLAMTLWSSRDAPAPSASQSPREVAAETYGRIPLGFEANRGQTDASVNFLARGAGYALFLRPAEAVLVLRDGGHAAGHSPGRGARTPAAAPQPRVLRMKVVGANAAAAAEGLEEQAGRVNYLVGGDQSEWRTDVPTYGRVRYAGVYPGVDLVYHGNQRQLEYDFHIAPGADAHAVSLEFDGADEVEVDAGGDLLLRLGESVVRQPKPFVYQEAAGARREVEAGYEVGADNRVRFAVGAYDRSAPLVIDPIIVYSSYLGGTSFGVFGDGTDRGHGIAVDSSGSVYVCGDTTSVNLPTTPDAIQRRRNSRRDAFVTKLTPAGTAIVYSTYLGGGDADWCFDIAVDSAGNAYVGGETLSTDFPTANAFQSSFGGAPADGFVTKLNAAGNALVYSTYLGGANHDAVGGVALDSSNNVYVTGHTAAVDFPTVGAIQATHAGSGPGKFDRDAFVTKLNVAGTALVYSTYLGGNEFDFGESIAVDSAGAAYVIGRTSSANFPTANAIQNGGSVFVTKLNPAGSAFSYSTRLGGSGGELVGDIAVDSAGAAYVVGTTFSTDFPTANAFQSTRNGPSDAFLTKLTPAGTAFVFSTYFGGGDSDLGTAIAVDASGSAHIIGNTSSTDLPTANPVRAANAGRFDAFVTKFNAAGTALIFSTYLGGGDFDHGESIAVDSANNVYLTGDTDSTDFPTVRPFLALDPEGNRGDAFITKIGEICSEPRPLFQFTQTARIVQEDVTVLTLAVERAGDSPGATTVDYATADGTASERSDYTTAAGTLRFAAGETGKTIIVLISEDSFSEGDETFTVTLSNPTGGAALSCTAAVATVTITDDAAETTTNPIDDTTVFVRQHYHDFLNREPDAEGFAHWTNVIDSCGADLQCREVNRINVSGAFFLSIEFQETGYLVERIYKVAYAAAAGTSTLGGTPHQLAVPVVRFEEFLPDTQRVGQGVVVNQGAWQQQLEANKVAFTQEFVQRQRFVSNFPLSLTPTDFVDRLNGRARGPLDAVERQALIDELTADNTTAGRASVLRKMAEHPKVDAAEKNRAFVLMQYFGYLRRNPNDAPDADYTGYEFWLGNLDRFNGNFVQAELVKAFITSTEYRQRFGQ